MVEISSTRSGRPAPPRRGEVAIVGAGIGGLVAANLLAARGLRVTVVERASGPGGKLRPAIVAGRRVDAGPTVLTLLDVLEEVLDAAGLPLRRSLGLRQAETLARHAWNGSGTLDLHADATRTIEAIGDFAGARAARGYQRFSVDAARLHRSLSESYLCAARRSTAGLVRAVGPAGLLALARVSPFRSLWDQLGRYFEDGRLRQLFGRYATYVGSSPFAAPATLAVIAHVEQRGVWLAPGGMYSLAEALEARARELGATFLYGACVEELLTRGDRVTGLRLDSQDRVDAGAVVVNADAAALRVGLFGHGVRTATGTGGDAPRSLSAMTWCLVAHCKGFPLAHHNVFFSDDYAAEFADLFDAARLPLDPTVYVCAQDRDDRGSGAPPDGERLLCLANAPALPRAVAANGPGPGDFAERVFTRLRRSGLRVERDPQRAVVTTPADFAARFPATGGALYGAATHGWRASFARPGARTAIRGLYLAGGSCHPGAGVPMAAVSGQLAAEALCTDLDSTSR